MLSDECISLVDHLHHLLPRAGISSPKLLFCSERSSRHADGERVRWTTMMIATNRVNPKSNEPGIFFPPLLLTISYITCHFLYEYRPT